MIYLDNAATTYPKPEEVYLALDKANREYGFNSGRGSYKKAAMEKGGNCIGGSCCCRRSGQLADEQHGAPHARLGFCSRLFYQALYQGYEDCHRGSRAGFFGSGDAGRGAENVSKTGRRRFGRPGHPGTDPVLPALISLCQKRTPFRGGTHKTA